MSSSCRRRALGVAGGLALAATQAWGAGWDFQPRIELRAIHDDNYRLTDVPGAEIEVTGAFLDAELALRSENPRGLIELAPRVRSSVFPDEGGEESTDWFVGFGWQNRTPRLETRIEADYADESVVTSELVPADFPDVDLGDTVAGDSGRVSVRNRRNLISLQPSLAWRWSPTRRLEAGLNYVDASYDQSLVEQTGFTDLVASAGIAVDVTQRDSLAGRLRAGTYEPEGARADTERAGIEGEWMRRWSPTMRMYVRAGIDTAETDVQMLDAQRQPVGAAVSETAFVGGVGAAWTYEVTELVLDAVRSVSPSSSGVVVDRDELRFRVRREVKPRLAAFANLRSIRTVGSVEEVAAVRDRDYLTARVGFEWRMNRPTRVLGAYDYAWQEFEGEPSDATSNAISISFVYEPRRRGD